MKKLPVSYPARTVAALARSVLSVNQEIGGTCVISEKKKEQEGKSANLVKNTGIRRSVAPRKPRQPKEQPEKREKMEKAAASAVKKNTAARPKSPRRSQGRTNTKKVRISFLGGLNEIGKNLTVYEYDNDMIIVDCGMAFPDGEMPAWIWLYRIFLIWKRIKKKSAAFC